LNSLQGGYRSKASAGPHGVSPGAVCSYHTCLFFLAAPKLSGLTDRADKISVPEDFETIRVEAYGPGGGALIVECRTDNRERTIARLRQIVREHGGHIGARGAVSYLFNEVGRLTFAPGNDVARAAAVALEAGAEDVIPAPLEVLTDPIDFDTVRAALQAAGFIPASADVTWRASMTVALTGEAAMAMLHLIEALKDLKDVENVYTNVEIPDEVLARS
jgi:transcriptional/translational regulatory protein YebC/TACO1